MAKKKRDQFRFYCEFRYLNSVTVKDAYPIPRIDESLSPWACGVVMAKKKGDQLWFYFL